MDGDVDVNDVLDLLAMWGPCLPGSLCAADFNGNLNVDVTDLLQLLAEWGTCGGAPGSIPGDVDDCLDKFLGVDTLALIKCIEAVSQ